MSRGTEPQCWPPGRAVYSVGKEQTTWPAGTSGQGKVAVGASSEWGRTETQSVYCPALLNMTIVALSGVVLPHGLTPFHG